jgi:hypothetical protein
MNIHLEKIAGKLAEGDKATVETTIKQRTQSPAPNHVDFL